MSICNANQAERSNQIRINRSYPADSEGRHWITVKVMAADKTMKNVRMLSDTGNDITILTRQTAFNLGYDPVRTQGTIFRVKGINGQPMEFKEIRRIVVIGNIPMTIPIGLAMSDEALSENLLGRAGVLDTGKIAFLFDNDSMEVIDKRSRYSVCGGRRL
ncbi:MAG: hypothetical protein R3321_01285 [Nitrososphaeraceae archaeon]|nr:hypothetical protein [Nitrososphaeraceae archaeon]